MVESGTIPDTIDTNLIDNLSIAFEDLWPIESQFTNIPCTDNLPNWSVNITFDDDTNVIMETNGSNFLRSGGPWQIEIDGQNYLQYSIDFIAALVDIIEGLDMPWGEPMAQYCSIDYSLFDQAFPVD